MVNVLQRAEAYATTMNDEQKAAIRAIAHDLDRLNDAVKAAVEAGLSVELQRSARHHHDQGYWGDLMTPRVVKQR